MSLDEKSPIRCQTCSATFVDSYVLKRHIRSTHNASSFICDVCSKTYNRKDNLKRHLRSHTITRDQPTHQSSAQQNANICPVCDKVFTRKDNMLKHQKSHDRVTQPNSEQPIEKVTETDTEVVNRPTETVEDESPTNLKSLLQKYKTSIDTYLRCQRILDIFNFRMHEETGDLREELLKIWRNKLTTRIKINCSPGFILKHKTTNELRYYHSSMNNGCLFEKPTLIRSESQLLQYIEKIVQFDILEWVKRTRPSTAWQIQMVTNMTFYITKVLNMGKVGASVSLPSYITRHRGLLALNKDRKHGKMYTDNLCFFRCLSVRLRCKCRLDKKCLCKTVNESHVKRLFHKYSREVGLTCSHRQFRGVRLKDLLTMEKLFNVSITVFELNPDGIGNVVWPSQNNHPIKLRLNLFDKHFSLIKSLQIFARAYECEVCERAFTQQCLLVRHKCQQPEKRLRFPNQCYKPPKTVFDKLEEDADIYVETERRFFPYRITYDIETYMSEENLPHDTDKLSYSARHRLLSVSICSNVPGYEQPRCFITRGDDEELVSRFVSYMSSVSQCSYLLLCEDFSDVLQEIDEFIRRREEVEETFALEEFSNKQTYGSRDPRNLKDMFLNYLCVIPVVGFNSQSYDLNVLKSSLLNYLHKTDKIKFTIKRDNKLQCIATNEFKFLDIINFIAPGFTYDRYIKAFGCTLQKGFFPYEYIKNINQLAETTLPPYEAFYSSLKQSNIEKEEYEYCQRVWKEEGMRTMADFLVWYNNLDTLPFQTAISRQAAIYQEKGIDMLKDAISLPGLAVEWKFHEVRGQQFDIPLITKTNSDLYKTIKENIVGGPSIIFHRYHEAGLTRLREREYGSEAKECKRVAGWDANALYLWSMAQDMPTGSPIRRRAENNFKPEFVDKYGRMAWGYLEYTAYWNNIHIQHKYNGGEKRVGQHGLPVDGFCSESNTVYQFHGCLFHGHSCHLTEGIEINPLNGMSMRHLRADTKKKEEYIKSLGYNLLTMYECHWLAFLELDPDIASFVGELNQRHMVDRGAMTELEVIQAIEDERFFGMVECDISVPASLHHKFSEMPPIFKNVIVTRDQLSEHMKDFAIAEDHLKRGQRMLIGSMFGSKILLLTPLARWYLEKGLQITKVYQIIQFKKVACFKNFAQSVSDARRDGDSDPNKVLLAETSKLVGNSVYGKTITNKERHRDVKYTDSDRKASLRVLNSRFVSLDELSDQFYEVIMEKSKITLDTPVTVGFAVLQYAKLRMLEFYYDCIDYFISRADYQYIEMDTDSAYMALSDSLEAVIKPELRREFYENYGDWFPKPFCSQHRSEFLDCKLNSVTWTLEDCCKKQLAYDKRTPGLFKEEFVGCGVVALNSKTYFCWSEDAFKFSSKGINKKTNQLTKQQYLDVLRTKSPVMGTNKGFVKKNNAVFTYSQLRTGLTYFYAKRMVCDDGVSTLPLTI